MSKKAKIIMKLLKSGKSVAEVAKATKTKPSYVYYLRWLDKTGGKAANPRKKKAKKAKKVSRLRSITLLTKKELDALLSPVESDPVNHPPHYKSGGIETIDFIEAKDLNYRLGNVIKYVSRAGRKLESDPVQDLEKAAFYLKREIDARKSA